MKKSVSGMRLVFGYLGIFMMFEGLITAFPLIILAFYPSEAMCYLDFLVPAIVGILLGALLFFVLIAGRPKGRFEKNEDAFLLVLLWISAVLMGAFPFYLTQFPSLNGGSAEVSLGLDFTESFFESMSGYATVGLTVFPTKAFLVFQDASSLYPCSHVFLFHRAFVQLIGGVGLVLIVAGAISDRYNLKLYFAEGHNDKLMPNLGRSAKLIFGIYLGYIILGTLSLWLAGMTVFDALCHSISALSTGGFSTRPNSYVFFNSGFSDAGVSYLYTGNGLFPSNPIALEIITMVLMLLGGTNFLLHTFLLTGKWKKFVKDIEVRFAFWIIAVATIVTALSTMYLYTDGSSNVNGIDFATSLRYSVFNVISSITTTGYTNFASVSSLGEVAVFFGIFLMMVGGGVGSTSGAIKQYRCAILWQDFRFALHHRSASEREINPNPVYRLGEYKEEDPATADEAHNYALLYTLFFLFGSTILMFLNGVSVWQGAYEFLSALSGTGIDAVLSSSYTVGGVVYTSYKTAYSTFEYEFLLWILSGAMFFGRLEILPVYYSIQRLISLVLHPFHREKNLPSKEA
jgi:trk system potassium uptake protein TrkH